VGTQPTLPGDPEQSRGNRRFRVDRGPVLSRDAGNITFVQTFDASGNLISQTVSAHGPHPSVADPNLFCDVLVPALS
jgi:YD repeat-containing protein